MKLNDIFQAKDETNALGAMKEYVDKNTGYAANVANSKLFGQVTPEAAALAAKTKQQAETYGRIFKMAPHLTPGVIFSLVNSGANDQTIAKVGLAAMAVEKANAEDDSDRGIFGDAYAALKTGTRWASAFGQLPWDLAQNGIASTFFDVAPNASQKQLYDFNLKNPLRSGVFASTEFGAMLANPKDTGEGIFGAGGKAGDYKSRKQMDFAGSIPLTIEAGAGENTAFEADPDQINTVAMQILATKDISYEEAYAEANRLIRSQARMSMQTFSVIPLALGSTSSLGVRNQFEFGDIGTPEYAMASIVAGLGAAVVIPDAAVTAWRNVAKPLFAYGKGISYVDDAGNFLMDSRNIAQNGAEAAHMANVDSLNVLANDFEVSGLAANDAAVEMLSPQPGTWYHGSRSGPLDGPLVSIEDPRYPTPEGNLYGPGLYLTESPIVGQSYAGVNTRGTRPMYFDEPKLFEGLVPQVNPAASKAPDVRLGQTDEYMGFNPNDAPGTIYRFKETEGATPNLLNPELPLVDQTTPEFIAQLANQWVDVNNTTMNGIDLLGPDDPISQLFKSLDIKKVVEDSHAFIVERLTKNGINRTHSSINPEFSSTSGSINNLINDKLFGGEINNIITKDFSLTANAVQTRFVNHLSEFIIDNGRAPLSADELKSFKGTLSFDDITTKPISAANGDKLIAENNITSLNIDRNIVPVSNQEKIIERLQTRISEINLQGYQANVDSLEKTGTALPFEQWIKQNPELRAEYDLLNVSNVLYLDYKVGFNEHLSQLISGKTDEFFNASVDSLDPRAVSTVSMAPELDLVFREAMTELAEKFNPTVSERISRMNIDDATRQRLELRSTSPGYQGELPYLWRPGGTNKIRTWLSINTWLSQNGVDGFQHMGGNIAGRGQFNHKVRILFDPMKHVDISDVLTGERLPVNEAINAARESGELATRAGELRTQADELEAMKEAGHLPGYGDMVDPETFNSFFTQSRAGKYAADKIWAVAEKAEKGNVTSRYESWYQLWEMFDGRLPLNIMDEIISAESKSEMVGIINKNVGYTPGLSNLGDMNFGLSKTFDRLKAVSRVDTIMEKAGDFAGPLFGRSPKSKTLDIFGSQRAQLQALRDLDSFLKTGVRGKNLNVVDKADTAIPMRGQIVARFAEAMNTGERSKLFEISNQISNIVYSRILEETGDILEAQASSDMWRTAYDAASGRGIYSVGEAGLRTDNGYAAVLADNGQYELKGMEHGGPGLLSELQLTPLELPDVQQLRRMTSFLGVFTGKQGLQRFIKKSELRTNALKKFGVDLSKKDLEKLGDIRVPLRLVDFAMTKVWKNAKKLSLAYGVRNTMEAQARLAFSDMDNVFTHSVDHILVATHNRLPDDIALGEEFNPNGWKNIASAHEGAGEGYKEMLGAAFYGSEGRMDMVTSQFKNSDFVVISKNDPAKWAKAGSYELRQLFNDPITRRLAAGAKVEDVIKWLNSEDASAQKALREIKNTMSSGEVFYDAAGNSKIVPVEPTPANIRLRIESMQKERLSLKTGSDPVLTEVVSSGTFNGAPAFGPKGEASKELISYLASKVEDPKLPNFYKGRGTDPKFMAAKVSQLDQATRMFFDGLMGRAHNFLDRSPLWRQEYTKEVNRLAPLLSPEAAAEMKQIIISRTENYASMAKSKGFARTFTVKDYLGRNVDADELFASLDNAKGWMSRDEIHAFANSLTLDKIEGLLFDASARNSVTDAARIVAPFGAAWAEVTKTWIGLLAKNPDKVVAAGRKFEILAGNKESESLRNKGILHKDPISGDWMYSLPMSGQVFKLFNRITGGEDTGSNYNLQAPLKGLNMVFNFTPGFSPVVGFPLGKIAYGSPKLRDFATFFMPYGISKSPTDISEYAPGWLSKVISAFVSNPRSAGVYADTLSEVIRVEMATGKYDLSIPEERKQFDQEAEHKARILTMMRGIGQGIGPASPTVEAKVRTKSGNIFSGSLTAEFHKLQSQDYDTAVERYIHMFGEEAYAFMAGKTKSLMSGVEASTEFTKWELENADLFDTPYGDIAGYFAPKGSNYDHAAWLYQINTGKRERVPPIPTQVAMAEYVLGMHKYRSFVEMAGPKPNAATRLSLAQQKLLLEKEYPGMVSESVMDVTKNDKNMKMLRLAVADPRLKNNETAMALTEYLDLRDMAMRGAMAAKKPWNGDDAAGLRATLRFQGERLVKETPEFARVFDRLLLPELDN